MEYNLCSFVIGKGRASWDKLFVHFHSPGFLFAFIPHKNSNFFYIIKSFSQIVLIDLLSLSLIEETFDRFLFDLSCINPARVISIMCSLAEDIILKYFLMLILDENTVKRFTLLDAALLIVDDLLSFALNGFPQFQR
jgi:hypothetical protein